MLSMATSSPTLGRDGGLPRITDDVIECVIDFLTPRDLTTASKVNPIWAEMCGRDSVWRRFCDVRWHLETPRKLLHASGTESFRELYAFLDRNAAMPRGRFTTKHQVVWGKNRQEEADVWLTIAHRSDCRLRTTRGQSTPFVRLRLVVQNLHHQPTTVDLGEMKVHWKDGAEGKILGLPDGELQATEEELAPRLVALNGQDRADEELLNRRITLRVFEFAVLEVNVECDECEFEADFLERCRAIWLPIRRPGPCTSLSRCRCGLIPDNYHHGSIRVPVVDESIIWKHYRSISGHFMVLDYRPSALNDPFADCKRSTSLVRAVRKASIS